MPGRAPSSIRLLAMVRGDVFPGPGARTRPTSPPLQVMMHAARRVGESFTFGLESRLTCITLRLG